MNKVELAAQIAEKVNLTKAQAEATIEAITEVVTSTIKGGGEVTISGFGSWSAKQRKARTGVNPQTKEKIQIPAVTVPKFKAGKTLKDALRS